MIRRSFEIVPLDSIDANNRQPRLIRPFVKSARGILYQLTAAKSRALARRKLAPRFLICRVAVLLEQLVEKERKEGREREREENGKRSRWKEFSRKHVPLLFFLPSPSALRTGELPSLTPWIVERSRPLLIPLHGWRAPREQVNQW